MPAAPAVSTDLPAPAPSGSSSISGSSSGGPGSASAYLLLVAGLAALTAEALRRRSSRLLIGIVLSNPVPPG